MAIVLKKDSEASERNTSNEEFFAKRLKTKDGFIPTESSFLNEKVQKGYEKTIEEAKSIPAEEHSWWSFAKAKLMGGSIGSNVRLWWMDESVRESVEEDPDFKITPEDIAGYEDFAQSIFNANNRTQLDEYKKLIDDIRLNQQIEAEHGVLTNLAGEILNPTSWFSLGMAGGIYNTTMTGIKYFNYGKRFANALNTLAEYKIGSGFVKNYGKSLLKTVPGNLGFGAALGTSQLITEETAGRLVGEGMSGTEMLQTLTTPMILGTAFGATIGATGELLLARKTKIAADRFKQLLQDPKNRSVENITIAINPNKLSESGYLYGKVKNSFGQALPMTPGIRTATSPSIVTREISRRMVDNFVTFVDEEGNVLTNNAATVESIANKNMAVYGTRITDEINKGFKQWLEQSYSGIKTSSERFKKALWGNSEKWDEFNALLADAARNGDKHTNPIVEKTAKALRPITNEIAQEGIDSGLYNLKGADLEKIDNSIKRIDSQIRKATKENNKPVVEKLTQQKEGLLKNRKEIENKKYTVEDFKRVGDESYLMRAFDKNKIVGNLEGFKSAVKAGMISKLKQKGLFTKENLTASEKVILKKLNQQLDVSVQAVVDDIQRNFQGRLTSRNYSIRGAEHERVLDFDTKYVKDFVVNHYADATYRFIQTIIPDSAMMRAFGTINVDDLFAASAKDYEALIKAAGNNNKEISRLRTNQATDRDDIEAMFNRVRGTNVLDAWSFTTAGRVINNSVATVKNLNVARLLGGTTMAGANDLGQLAMVLGFKRFYGKQTLKALIEFVKGKTTGGSIIESEPLFRATTLWRQTRQASFGEIVGGQGVLAWASRWTRGLANSTTFLSGIQAWDETMKFLSGYITSETILKAGEKLFNQKNLTKKEDLFLRTTGITNEQAIKIYGQFKQHGQIKNGLYAPGSTQWTDRKIKELFGAAIMKLQNQAILTPGAGTVPVSLDHPFFRLFNQFKRFTWSAYEKCMIPGLQKRDFSVFAGAVMMMNIGVLRSLIRMKNGGYELTETQLIEQALKECDFMSYYGDIYGLGASLVGFSTEQNSANQDFLRSVQGTVLGFGSDVTKAAGGVYNALFGAGASDGQIHALRKLLPSQNNPAFAYFFNKAEETLKAKYGKRKTR